MVLAVGNIAYKADALEILRHYFTLHSIPYTFIEQVPTNVDLMGSHPSWWKLLAHSILPGYDYIICWDLDLLPRSPDVEVMKDFDMTSMCLAWDSDAKANPDNKFLPSFKYNGGLIGIPSSFAAFTTSVFRTHAPGTYPSYEQYYLNEELQRQSIPVHELSTDINVLCSFPEFESARLQHYTYADDAKQQVHPHYLRYFNITEYDTRIDMIRSLVPVGSKLCELGVFRGDMARVVHAMIQPSLYVLIDFFQGIMGSGDQDGNNFQYVDLAKSYANLVQYYRSVPAIQVIRGDGVASLNAYPDDTFDMVYIDADHSYEGCKHDLEASFKKVKVGGYIMGHDYEMNMRKAQNVYHFGVKQAVDEFCLTRGLRICAKGLDGCVSYAIRREA
jgi:hypothetical protein